MLQTFKENWKILTGIAIIGALTIVTVMASIPAPS